MKDHQLWLDTINMNIKAGKTLEEAVRCADVLSEWPFKYVNGEQTPESVALETSKPDKVLTQYERVMSDPDTKDAPL